MKSCQAMLLLLALLTGSISEASASSGSGLCEAQILKAAHKCMSFKPSEILDIEQPQRKKLKWGQYNKC